VGKAVKGGVQAMRASALGQAPIISDRYQRDILVALLVELEVFAELPEEVMESGDPHVVGMIGKGVPYTPDDWFGSPLSDARRKALSRAARRLEAKGFVRRITDPNRGRLRYLRPTPDGLREFFRLVPNADPAAACEGLCRTAWGRELLAEINRDETGQRAA
jgi:hypothetical protein